MPMKRTTPKDPMDARSAGTGRLAIVNERHDDEDARRTVRDESRLVAVFCAASRDGSATEAIHSALVAGIEEGILQSGARLGEHYLATLFSISRTPVREALGRLEAQHLAERDGRGMVVARISVEQIIEIYAVREALDGAAARLAATHAQILDLEELELINAQLRDFAVAARYDDMADLNIRFHDVLARAGRNQMLYHFIQEVLSVVRRFKTTTFSHPGRALEAVEEHEHLLAALRTRNTEAAERIARQHMRDSLNVRIQLEIGARTAGGRP